MLFCIASSFLFADVLFFVSLLLKTIRDKAYYRGLGFIFREESPADR